VAGNPRIYGQLVGLLGKYSKFASAGEKASVRQAEELVPPQTTPSASLPDAPGDSGARDA
jgi:myo-inositol-1(or 4)-monophosphatase